MPANDVIGRLGVAYSYLGPFGIPFRLSYPLGRLNVRPDRIELRPLRLLSLFGLHFTIFTKDVLHAGRNGMMIELSLRDGTWVRVGNPRKGKLDLVLRLAGIAVPPA